LEDDRANLEYLAVPGELGHGRSAKGRVGILPTRRL
jgi:hypothetical protein